MRGTDSDRGQAITLEGFIASMVILTAMLLALQSVVITPSTGGAVDRTVQSQLQQEAKDALLTAETIEEGDQGMLTRFLLYYNDSGEFHNADQEFGEDYLGYNTTAFKDNVDIGSSGGNPLGEILYQRFDQQGWSYNLHLINESGHERRVIYQGQPTANAFTASYFVTLYDDSELLDDGGTPRGDTLGANGYPFPDADSSDVYTVVEVRLTVW